MGDSPRNSSIFQNQFLLPCCDYGCHNHRGRQVHYFRTFRIIFGHAALSLHRQYTLKSMGGDFIFGKRKVVILSLSGDGYITEITIKIIHTLLLLLLLLALQLYMRNYIAIDTCSEKRPLPSTTCFSTKTRPFPIPLPLVNFEPNISRIYTPQLKSWVSLLRSTPMKMERIERSETSALKAQTPGDYPKDTIRHSTHGESLKSRLTLYELWPAEQFSSRFFYP